MTNLNNTGNNKVANKVITNTVKKLFDPPRTTPDVKALVKLLINDFIQNYPLDYIRELFFEYSEPITQEDVREFFEISPMLQQKCTDYVLETREISESKILIHIRNLDEEFFGLQELDDYEPGSTYSDYKGYFGICFSHGCFVELMDYECHDAEIVDNSPFLGRPVADLVPFLLEKTER